jgi:hypothetical protein
MPTEVNGQNGSLRAARPNCNVGGDTFSFLINPRAQSDWPPMEESCPCSGSSRHMFAGLRPDAPVVAPRKTRMAERDWPSQSSSRAEEEAGPKAVV